MPQAHHTGEVAVVKTGGYGVRVQFSRSFCLTLAELTEEELLEYERAERELHPKEGEDMEEDEVDDEDEEEDVEDEEDDDEEAAANNPGKTNAADEEAGASNEIAATNKVAANKEVAAINEVANNEVVVGETNAAKKSLKWLTATMDQMKQMTATMDQMKRNKECNNEDKSGDAGATIKVEPSLGVRVGPEDPIYLSSDDEEEEEDVEDEGDSREQLLQKLKQLRAESKKREQAWAGEEPRMKVEPGAVKKEPGSTPFEARQARRQLVKAFWASKTRDHVTVLKFSLICSIQFNPIEFY